MRLILSMFLVIGGCFSTFAQQLPNSSIFGASDFRFNPAMTAPGEYLEWGVTYREQWLGFEQAPQAGSAFIQYPLVYQNMSIGGSVGYDEAGPLKNNDISINYSYKLGIGNDAQLAIGILARLNQYRFNGNNAIATDAGDLLLLQAESSKISPNFGFGLHFVSNTGMYDLAENAFFIGVGSNQLLQSQLNFAENEVANLKRAIHANGIIGARLVNNVGYFEPSFWMIYSEENLFYGTLRLNFEMEDIFWAGLSYTTDATVGVQGGLVLNSNWLGNGQLRVGGAGNYNVGVLSDYKGLGFEVLVGYRYGL